MKMRDFAVAAALALMTAVMVEMMRAPEVSKIKFEIRYERDPGLNLPMQKDPSISMPVEIQTKCERPKTPTAQ
jgi:hypothetical protein